MARRQRATVSWRDYPPRLLAERAEVTERRDDGFYRVVNLDAPDDLVHGVWWMRPFQTGGAKVGDRGRVVYQTTPSSGLAYFIREQAGQ